MSEFYIKDKNSKYIPIAFKQIVSKDWENKLIVVRIGTDENPANSDSEEQTLECLNDADALSDIEMTSFLVTRHNVEFSVLNTLKEIGEKNITVQIMAADNLSDLDEFKKIVKKQLKGNAKKVVFLPAPITIDEYKEIIEIKRRCETRRSRRGQ